jgi:hypothetical protein
MWSDAVEPVENGATVVPRIPCVSWLCNQADLPVIQAVIASLGGRMLPARGAVPVYQAGELVGAIGAI